MTKQYVGSDAMNRVPTDERAPHPVGGAVAALEPRRSFGAVVNDALMAFWKAITANGKMATGTVIVGIFILVGIFGPMLAPYDPQLTSKAYLLHPSPQHL